MPVGSKDNSFDDSVFITLTEKSKSNDDKISDTPKPAFIKESGSDNEKPKILKTFKRRADLRLPSWPPQDNFLFIVERPPLPGFKNISLVHEDWGNEMPQGPKKSPWAYDYESSDSGDSDVVTDDICESFMKWGVCSSGDNCKHRHPSCRYPQNPHTKISQENTSLSYNAPESRAGPPISEPPSKQCKEPYAKVLSRMKRMRVSREDPSLVALRSINSNNQTLKKKYEEAWPSLTMSKKGNQVETRGTETQHGSTSSNSSSDISLQDKPVNKPSDFCQVTNDRAIAEVVQEEEYTDSYDLEYNNGLDEYDEDELFGSYNDSHSTQEGVFVTANNNESECNPFRTNTSTMSYGEKLAAFSSLTQGDGQTNHRGSETDLKTVPLEQSTEVTDPTASFGASIQISHRFNRCDICREAPKDATLLCGHRFCFLCAHQMRMDERQCAICRRSIVTVIKTFN